jgi:hypothetical protein
MNKTLLLAAFAPFGLFGQITVTNADFSDAGDNLWVSNALDLQIDFASTGANYTWDFSNLVATDQANREYLSVSNASILVNFIFGSFANQAYQATNYAASSDIPIDQLTSFLPVTITDIFLFSKNSSSAINSVGYAISIDGTEVPFKSDTIETRYELPLNFGDTYSSRGYTNLDMNPIYNGIWRQHRYRESEVDGWGSVTTPYGTFDALRVKHRIQESDSLFVEFNGFPVWLPLPIPDAYIYEWWTNGQKEPVMRINTSSFGGTETPTSVQYLDDYWGIGLEEEELNVSIYPNPATDVLHLEGQGSLTYSIVSSKGELMDQGTVMGNGAIQVSQLNPGSYLLVIRTDRGIETQIFVRQ